MRIFSGTIASSFNDVNFMVLDIIELLRTKCDIQLKELLFKISFMLREVLNNAVEHGNRFDTGKKVTCYVDYDAPFLNFIIQDEGGGVDLSMQPFDHQKDYLLRERHRGYALIQELNFLVEISGNQVSVKLDLTNMEQGGTPHGETRETGSNHHQA